MKNPFDGHRVYNGCPDSTLQARWDNEARILEEIKALSPGAKCCFFPMEVKYVVHDREYRDISIYHYSKLEALKEALSNLKGAHK